MAFSDISNQARTAAKEKRFLVRNLGAGASDLAAFKNNQPTIAQ